MMVHGNEIFDCFSGWFHGIWTNKEAILQVQARKAAGLEEWGRGVGHELARWAIAFHIQEMGAELAKACKAA